MGPCEAFMTDRNQNRVFCEFLKGYQVYTVWRNFVQYGPSARTLLDVLAPGTEVNYQFALENYKKKLELKVVSMLRSNLMEQIEKKWLDKDSHTVILTSPSPSSFLLEPVRSFIAPYVAQLFTNIQDDMVRGECAKLFLALEQVPNGSTYRGRIFEPLLHKLMERGATLLRQNIRDADEPPVSFSPVRTVIFNRLPLLTEMIRANKGSPNIN